MFKYLDEHFRFKIMLGQIISHDIVRPNSTLRDVDELNKLDRYDLAEFAIQKIENYRYANLLAGKYHSNQLMQDVAHYIDKRIPQSYIKWKTARHDIGPTQITANILDFGLTYYFDKAKKTEDFQNNQIDSKCEIGNDKHDIASKEPEDNYSFLTRFLKEHSLYLEKDRFKAILSTMNGMTQQGKTKEKAIKDASSIYGVPKIFISDLIKQMGIKSKREIDSKKRYSQQLYVSTVLKKRLEREE